MNLYVASHFGPIQIRQILMMGGGKHKPKIIKPQSNDQSYNAEDPPIFDSSVELELRTQIRKMFNIVNQEKSEYKHLKEPNKVKSSKFNILSNIDFTVLEGQSLLEKQKRSEVLETQTEEWRDIQDLYISKYRSETRCLSIEEKQALRLNVIEFLGKRGMNTLDCRRILSRLCKYLLVNDIYFHELIFQLKERKAIKEAQQQFQETFKFLQDLYKEERTNLVKFAPKMAEDLFGKVVKEKYFPGNLIFRELERQQMAQNLNNVKEEQLVEVHQNLHQAHNQSQQ